MSLKGPFLKGRPLFVDGRAFGYGVPGFVRMFRALPLNRFLAFGIPRASSGMHFGFVAVFGASPLNRFLGLGTFRASSNMLLAFVAVN